MSKFALLLIATGAYWIACAGIGVWTSRRKIMKPSDFFLAGGGLGPIVMSLAMMATVFSAWFILGHQGMTWQHGVPYVAHFMHIPLMGMISAIFFPRLWVVSRKHGYITPSEMYGDYFGSEILRILIVVVAALYAIPYVALQLRGAGYVFHTLSGGEISATTGAVVLGIVVVLYVFLGGLEAAAVTDTLQGALLLFGAFLLGLTTIEVVSQLSGGQGFLHQFSEGIRAQGPAYITLPALGKTWSWPYILGIAIATCGIYISPSYTMLVSAAKSPKIFKFQGLIVMTVIMGFMYFIFSALTGMGGRSIVKELANADSLTLEIVFNHMSPFAFIVTALGILAAMNSTAAGYLANTSTIFARDLYLRYVNPTADAKKQVLMGRAMILVIVAIAVIFSFTVLDMLVLLGTFATAFGLLLLPSMFAITYCPSITKDGVNAGLFCGIITVILTYFVWRYPLGMHMGGWGLLVNSVVCWIVSAYTQKPAQEKIASTHGLWDERYR